MKLALKTNWNGLVWLLYQVRVVVQISDYQLYPTVAETGKLKEKERATAAENVKKKHGQRKKLNKWVKRPWRHAPRQLWNDTIRWVGGRRGGGSYISWISCLFVFCIDIISTLFILYRRAIDQCRRTTNNIRFPRAVICLFCFLVDESQRSISLLLITIQQMMQYI